MKEKIIQFCHSIGLDTAGMIPCRSFDELRAFLQARQKQKLQNEFEENDLEKRINPAHYMEDAKTILSIAFPYFAEENTVDNGFSIYTKRLDYHRVGMKYLNRVVQYIEELGGKAQAFVDSNTLPERYIAYLAGNGFIGRNNMLITRKYGSYVFLGEILTNLELECQDKRSFQELVQYQECGDCKICYHECPTKSINKNKSNPNICLSYLTQKKEISEKEISLLKGNIFGCDFCQLKCPYNEKAEKSGLEEFAVLEYMNEDVRTFAGMDNKYFKEKVNLTSCGWRGKNVIRRNALIQMAKEGYDLTKFKGDSSYVNGYIDKLRKNNTSEERQNES